MYTTLPILLEIVHPYQLLEGMYFFLLVIAGVILFIAFYLVKRSRTSAQRRQLRNEFSDFISELAVCDTDAERNECVEGSAIKIQINRWLADDFARRTLIRELTATVKNMSGQAAANICWFYETSGLHKDSLEQLKSKHWHVKARAIQQLAHLQQARYITRIYRLTNDKHELVRNEARIAVVKLTGFEGLRFLDVITYPITDWQQISLLHELAQHRRIVFPAMERLLQSPNSSVIEFTLRLIATYQVYDLQDAVLKCLQLPQPAVREKALAALKEIGDATAAQALTQHFPNEEPRLQIQLLEVIQQIGTAEQIPFLLLTLSNTDNDVKAAAARAIRELQPNGLHLVAQQVSPDSYPWNQLLPQLKQEVRA